MRPGGSHELDFRQPAAYRYDDTLPPESAMLEEILKGTEIQQLFESYYNLLNVPVAVIDLKANVLLSSRWRRICTQFHRAHPATCARCIESDTRLAVQLQEGKDYAIYECQNGLTDCASPIILDGKQLANVFIGQFLTHPPDEAWFRRQAEQCGFDVPEYLQALREVPVVEAEKIPAILDLLARMTRVITTLGVDRKRAIESQGRHAVILDTIPQSVFWKDLQGRYLGCNAAFARAAGMARPEEIAGKSDFDLPWPRHETEAYRADDRAVISANRPKLHIVEPLQQADGSRIVIDTSKIPLVDAANAVCGVVGIYEDITERKRAEERVRESEEKFRKAFMTGADAFYIATLREGKIVEVNESFEDVFGYKREEAVGKTSLQLGLYADPNDRHEWVSRMESEGQVRNLRLRSRKKDGKPMTILLSANLLPGGEEQLILGVVKDITEQTRAEEALRESEEKYRVLYESSRDAIMMLSPPGWRFTMVNPRAVELFAARDRESFMQVEPWRLSPERQLDGELSLHKARRMIETAMERGTHFFEWTHRKFNGEDFSATVDLTRMVYLEQVQLQATVRDVTAQKRAEAEVRKLSRALEQSPVSVIITDRQGKIEYVNPKFSQTTGYKLDEARGENPRFLKSGETAPEVYRELWEKITSGREWQGELLNRKKDGTLYWEQASISPIRDSSGEITHFLAVKEDITARKALEAQLRQAQKMEAVGRLAGGVAHDFNNLLTIINGYSELLLVGSGAEDPRTAHLDEIRKAGERASALTRQLLAFSRSQVIEPRVLELNGVLTNLQKMLRRLIGEDVELRVVPGEKLGQVRADPGQVEQVILNLSINARDAMPGGGYLTLETANAELDQDYARAHAEVSPGQYVLLAVSDTGCGMDAETQSHIFEPFFTTKENGKGTGLGLATVYGIVKQAGGHLNVYSEVGHGTTFKVYFPRLDQPAEVSAETARATGRWAGTETILVAEDELAVRVLIGKTLQAQGYTVLEAANPQDAVSLAEQRTGPIHLLLTDVILPGFSGKELADHLQFLRPDIKVLFMSGYTGEAIAHHGVLNEGADFLPKPFTSHGLLGKVRDVLDAKKAA